MFANIHSAVFFSCNINIYLEIIIDLSKEIRVMSARPDYGPSSGGTIISLLGTGFADTGR